MCVGVKINDKTISGALKIIIPEKTNIADGITDSKIDLKSPFLFHKITHIKQYEAVKTEFTIM